MLRWAKTPKQSTYFRLYPLIKRISAYLKNIRLSTYFRLYPLIKRISAYLTKYPLIEKFIVFEGLNLCF